MAFTLKSIQAASQGPSAQSHVIKMLSDSAEDFLKIVWPGISQLPIVGGGKLQPVEAVSDKNFKDQLDLLAGIDAWHIQANPSSIRGLASRVQWGVPYRTFTIRTRSKGGGETELEKRARAIANRENGHLYPHLTVQAFLDKKGGELLCAAVIKTTDLITRASFLQANMKHNRNWFGYRDNPDGSQFMYIAWDDLLAQQFELGILSNDG
ncbi:MAG TPA: hypothetical protein VN089_09210 [Duganella sp.]|nr:hypothetical protein [Duganella sp.]